jgi:hypothetical protein
MTFAVWGYVLAKMRPERGTEVFRLEINPMLLGAILGEKPEDVEEVINKLCSPDERSRSNGEEGRRLVREGQFLYRVVNGAKYNAGAIKAMRRKYHREYARANGPGGPSGRELTAEKLDGDGKVRAAERLAESANAPRRTRPEPEDPPVEEYEP